ncbi:hypothetical protein BCR34DRAFT_593984 [Clohesyomyces aquaticus]|uniref:Uncharacterized protein n=1 Tax=Clohesyomyces aquaticus TaxID=1231657 RepID=A0A1Y1YEB5_9PLEO|nr:hypothetical protein BCR34DRAFT_593984 [Clohesyomyces aquaticus]
MAHRANEIPWQSWPIVSSSKSSHATLRIAQIWRYWLSLDRETTCSTSRTSFLVYSNDSSAKERVKYQAKQTPPEPDEIFISDVTVVNISKEAEAYKDPLLYEPWYPDRPTTVRMQREERCIPFWIANLRTDWDDDFGIDNLHTLQILRSLLHLGDLDPLFRVAAHPDISLAESWILPRAYCLCTGWSDINDAALRAYICLNAFYLKSETHNTEYRNERSQELHSSQKTHTARPETFDYRCTCSYQQTVIECTGTYYANLDFHTCPHRMFFGVPKGMFLNSFVNSDTRGYAGKCGRTSLASLRELEFQGQHIRSKDDIPAVINILGRKGLPAELA